MCKSGQDELTRVFFATSPTSRWDFFSRIEKGRQVAAPPPSFCVQVATSTLSIEPACPHAGNFRKNPSHVAIYRALSRLVACGHSSRDVPTDSG